MNNISIKYNEKSWAIDLISHINAISSRNNLPIKRAGGESTIQADGGNLFPDVLLFGSESLLILQGWELKMPDTSIDDHDFLHNATQKAKILGLDSFVLWNVSYARLYVCRENGEYICQKQWNNLAYIQRRDAVQSNEEGWKQLAEEIIGYLNGMFDDGSLEGRPFIEAYKSGGITSLIMTNYRDVSRALEEKARTDIDLRSEIILWSHRYQAEYKASGEDSKNPYNVLAKANISNWIGKFLFAHVLQSQDTRASVVRKINGETTPAQALAIFENLSEECDFWTIFGPGIGLSIIPDRTWSQVLQLNDLLNDLRVREIDQVQLSSILEASVDFTVRKLRGQYATPLVLARLLVKLCIHDIGNDRVLDPCCGSGTIPRAALDQKLSAGVSSEDVASTVFAGDQDILAVQIAGFAMARHDLMNLPLRLYQGDAFQLEAGNTLEFRNPTTGELLEENVGTFDAIVSNLPFIAQNNKGNFQEDKRRVNNALIETTGKSFSNRKADISAYFPFVLHSLLIPEGRLGIIITNSWLGTAWGDVFFDLICRYYTLVSVITSGSGRWFKNSKVVTNVLILRKKDKPSEDSFEFDPDINFVVLKKPLEESSNLTDVTAAQIRTSQTQDDIMTLHSVSPHNMGRFRSLGLGGNAQFVHSDWILDLPLVPLRELFQVRRGERRGWDKMFYPTSEHDIESEYIRPVLKSPGDITRYTAVAEGEAFSCAIDVQTLNELGHVGAHAWIRRFEQCTNKKGKPLPEVLARPGKYWYEMSADTWVDLAMPINPGDRLFVARLNSSAFLNQRLISLKALDDGVDIELCHALLNSAISMFIIEGMGFGRGEGVLDLSKNRIEQFMHMLDPNQLDVEQSNWVKSAFEPLLQRDILDVADELDQQDRKDFDDSIIEAFDLNLSREQIYGNILGLIGIRQAATQG